MSVYISLDGIIIEVDNDKSTGGSYIVHSKYRGVQVFCIVMWWKSMLELAGSCISGVIHTVKDTESVL